MEHLDLFKKDASELKRKKLWLFDLDGTIYNEEQVFDGTFELLEKIENQYGRYVFITNNSSKSVCDYIKKLEKLGLKTKRENFFTSTQATILYLKENYPEAKIYCQGTKSFINELLKEKIKVTEKVEKVDVVLVGFDIELTMHKLRNTCEILSKQDVIYLATNPDLCCPVSFGFIPDCGSICGMIKNATGREPIYMGKPDARMIDIVGKEFGYKTEEIVMVGDRLYTDILTGKNANITTICVLTGETTIEKIMEEKTINPSLTFYSVREISNVLFG